MSSKTRAVMGAVKTALATINGTGGYVHNLSAADQVRVGRPTMADTRLPAVWIAVGSVESSHGPQLGRYRRDLVIDIDARAPAGTDSTEERGFIAADLLDDVMTALESDRTLGGLVLDVIVSGVGIDGDEAGIPGVAVAVGQVAVYWYATSAAGM